MNCTVALAVASCSQCPNSGPWVDLVAPLIAAPKMAFWNIGANKGYNVNEFLQRHASGWKVSNQLWHRYLKDETATPYTCGACHACTSPLPSVAPQKATQVSIVAVELINATATALQVMQI